MRWRKLGRVFAPSGEVWWARSYATMPTVEVRGDRLRVYYAGLDEVKRGRIGCVDLAAEDPRRVIAVSSEPVLDLGRAGLFDDSGVNPSCLLVNGERRMLYYVGWQRCEAVPFLVFAGLAVSVGEEPFVRVQPVPVLERSAKEPFLRSATSVVGTPEGFMAWYVSGIGWIRVQDRLMPTYVIRAARSEDGIRWASIEGRCIDFRDEDEYGFGRPWVVRDRGLFRMWYSIRSRCHPYRLGYAESIDGLRWTRKDEEVGLDRSQEGWDSGMVCYPCVIDVGSQRYMFYNGNRHGESGFGCAVLEG